MEEVSCAAEPVELQHDDAGGSDGVGGEDDGDVQSGQALGCSRLRFHSCNDRWEEEGGDGDGGDSDWYSRP